MPFAFGNLVNPYDSSIIKVFKLQRPVEICLVYGFDRLPVKTKVFSNLKKGHSLAEAAEVAAEIDIERAKAAMEKAKKELKKLSQEDKDYLIEAARLEKPLIRLQVAERAGKTIIH